MDQIIEFNFTEINVNYLLIYLDLFNCIINNILVWTKFKILKILIQNGKFNQCYL